MTSGEERRRFQINVDPEAEKNAIALAAAYNVDYVDLRFAYIPDCAIELVHRGVAIENSIIPFGELESSLILVTSDPADSGKLERLRFILNRDVRFAVAPKPYIDAAIAWYYPEVSR